MCVWGGGGEGGVLLGTEEREFFHCTIFFAHSVSFAGSYFLASLGIFFSSFTPLKVIPLFCMRGSSAHEGKIVIFEKFHCFLTKII